MSLKNRIIHIILTIVLGTAVSHAQWKLESVLHSLVVRGIDFILEQDYDRADSLFSVVTRRYPEHPVGYLYRAAVMQAYNIDFDVPIEQVKFDSLLTIGKSAAEKISLPWGQYFLGTADGYEAYERVERGDWFGGVRKGMSLASKFEEIIKKDSSFYDAYVGIGTYYYWRSRKLEFLQWLPFIKDDRELGIRMLIIGAEQSVYNRFAAISALVSIYLDAENYQQAEEWSKRGLNSYPENRVFLWGLATALDRQNCSAEAISAYSNLLENIVRVHAPHPYNEIVCRLNLVKSKIALNDTTTVSDNLKQLLSYETCSFPANLQSRVKAKFEEARKLLLKLEHQRTALK
jgi:tetratricopeptide (TPR) repeat protein